MPKKFTILASLAALSISTLGTIVPTFADTTEYYYVPELTPIHAQYAERMATECGLFIKKDNTFKKCYNSVTNAFRDQYGGLFESMFQLDFNGRMIVTGLNPTAGTIRFYLDETMAFKNYPFTLQNLVIFWADVTAEVSPAWNDTAGWQFVDNFLATGEIPQGYHVLYSGARGDENWAPNTEMRVTFGDDTTAYDLVHQSDHKFIYLYGYDTDGNRHLESNYLESCFNGELSSGGECRLQYIYDGSGATPTYINADPTDEDRTIIDLKAALKAKTEAEANLAAAEARVASLEEAYQEAENRASEAENRASAAESRASEAENKANAAASTITELERELNVTEKSLEDSKKDLAKSEESLEKTQKDLADSQKSLEETKQALEKTQKTLEEIKKALEETKKSLEEAKKSLEEAKKTAADAIARVNALLANPVTITKYQTIKNPITTPATPDNHQEVNSNDSLSGEGKNTENSDQNYVEVPVLGGNKEHTFPWWIIVFIFSGIALVLWWFVPVREKRKK